MKSLHHRKESDLGCICSQCCMGWSSKAVEADIGVVGVEADDNAEELSSGKVDQEPD